MPWDSIWAKIYDVWIQSIGELREAVQHQRNLITAGPTVRFYFGCNKRRFVVGHLCPRQTIEIKRTRIISLLLQFMKPIENIKSLIDFMHLLWEWMLFRLNKLEEMHHTSAHTLSEVCTYCVAFGLWTCVDTVSKLDKDKSRILRLPFSVAAGRASESCFAQRLLSVEDSGLIGAGFMLPRKLVMQIPARCQHRCLTPWYIFHFISFPVWRYWRLSGWLSQHVSWI